MSNLVKNQAGTTIATLANGTGRVLLDGEQQDTPAAGDHLTVSLDSDHIPCYPTARRQKGYRNG